MKLFFIAFMNFYLEIAIKNDFKFHKNVEILIIYRYNKSKLWLFYKREK